jgi:1,4-dihydroxy-2-naphthoyl-CoA synthase
MLAVLRLLSCITTANTEQKETSMPANPVLWNLDERGVATVTLNRPEVNNAYDADLIDGVLRRWMNSARSLSFESWS